MRSGVSGDSDKIRNISVKIECSGSGTFSTNKIVDLNISRTATDGSFGIGFAPSGRLSCTVISDSKILKKERVTVSVDFGGGWKQFGRFYADSCIRNGSVISIIAYDAMSLQTKKLVRFGGVESKGLDALGFPCKIQDMLEYIKTYRGLSCEFTCNDFDILEKPFKNADAVKDEDKYYTVRELLGFIAAAHGCNAMFDADGTLVFRPYTEVSAGLNASNVIDCTIDDSEPLTITGVLISKSDDTIYIDDVPGSEYDEDADGVVKCSIPFCDLDIANYIWTRIGNLSYYGGSIKIRGAGKIECGDVLSIRNLKYPADGESYKLCVTGVSYSISREDGFIETITSNITRTASGYSSGSSGASGSGSCIGKDLGEKNVSFNDLASNSVEREAHLNAIFGERNRVGNGVCNIVGGSHNYVNTSYSLAIGEFLNVSDEASQIVCGVYNAPQGGARFVVGNGSGEGSRSNAAWISAGGDMTLMGSLYAQDAVCEGLGTFRRGLNIPLGDGIRTVDVFEGEVLKSKLTLKLGDGMEFSPDPDFPDNSKLLTLNIGEGLEFTAEEAAEGESAPEESKKLSLKRATVNNIGGIQLGEGLSLNNVTGKTDIMQASSTRLGGIKLGEGLVRNTETGGTDIRKANGAQLGGIILGNGLAYNNETGKTDLAKATGGQLGGIILGEGLELNSETGKVDVTGGGGLTVENAVIIQEANAHYILHNYTVVDYIDGNKVCYAGPQNQIIVNGYVFNKNSADLSDIGRAMYPAARFDKAGTSTSNMISNVDFYFDIVSVIPEYATIWAKTAPEFYWYTSALNTFDLSRTGIAFTWDAFYPPCDGHPYGFVYGLPRICYVSDAEGTFVSTAMYGRCYFDFASEAEYNAAIRLTYEPNTLKQIVDQRS